MHFTFPSKYRWTTILLAFLTFTFAGCGSDAHPRAKVKGKVKFFDKYLTAGNVAFISKDGKATGSANIDADGNYEMTDAPLGEVTIIVRVPTVKSKDIEKKMVPPKGMPPMMGGGGAGSDSTTFVPSNFDASKIVQIPGKYGSADTSGLTFIVEKGMNQKDITLSP